MSFSNHTLILKNDGTLWGCGNNSYGQLGLGDTTNRNTFTQITTNTDNIKSVYCGYSYTLILKNDGTLWGSGYNGYGQLGLGDTTNRTTFTKITVNTDNIKSVHYGCHCIFVLKNDGTLYGCGSNGNGQLGLGDKSNRTVLTQITTNTDNIKSVYCGYNHTIVLKNDDTLWGCGKNEAGQLGLGDTNNRSILTKIATNTNNIKLIYCGNEYTIMLKNDGTLWGSGYNQYCQLGLGDATYRSIFTIIGINSGDIKEVCPGGAHIFILKNDGTLWGCGLHNSGQLGLGSTSAENISIFTRIVTNVNDIKSVYGGFNHTLMLKNDGTLWGTGDNQYGQLGLGNNTNKNVFTQITTNISNIKCFANDYSIPSTTKIYDTKIGYVETLDTNNFRNIPVDKFEKIKVLCVNPLNTHLNCLISFDKKQTWKIFDGTDWITISNISPENIILNGMEVSGLNQLDKKKLISGGFTGDLDFKIAMKTNDKTVTSSVTKIYIEYK